MLGRLSWDRYVRRRSAALKLRDRIRQTTKNIDEQFLSYHRGVSTRKNLLSLQNIQLYSQHPPVSPRIPRLKYLPSNYSFSRCPTQIIHLSSYTSKRISSHNRTSPNTNALYHAYFCHALLSVLGSPEPYLQVPNSLDQTFSTTPFLPINLQLLSHRESSWHSPLPTNPALKNQTKEPEAIEAACLPRKYFKVYLFVNIR